MPLDREPDETETLTDGRIVCRWFDQDGRKHRAHAPAETITDPATGERTEIFYRHGKIHRDRGPAVIERHPRVMLAVTYFHDGEIHRDDGPAWIKTEDNGTRFERWQAHGEFHRDDGPAWDESFADGTRIRTYFRVGAIHRDGDEPAKIYEQPDGLKVEEYYLNGLCHRERGPAKVKVAADGAVTEEFWRDGKKIAPDRGSAPAQA